VGFKPKLVDLDGWWWPNLGDVPADPQRPSPETIEWAKSLVAAGFTDGVVAELLELVRHGTDDRAEMAAWTFTVGDIPANLRTDSLHGLLDVVTDTHRFAEVRGQAAEAVAQQLEFSGTMDPLRQAAEATLIGLLNDDSPIVRFWGAFGLGTLKTRAALPLLQALTSDNTPVPRWWTGGEEAADAIERIEGRVPLERVAGTAATPNPADPASPPRADDTA